MIVLWKIGTWQRNNYNRIAHKAHPAGHRHPALPRGKVISSLGVLVALVFSKYVYLTSLTSYYTFYLIDRFSVSIRTSQLFLFVFLFSVALGSIVGGPVGDQIGRKRVIWFSILGVAPFSLALPHVGLVATAVLTVFIGLILASAFSAIIVYAQELVPGKVGMVAGLFFGLAFGSAGIGSAALGQLADHTSIEFVFAVCAFLPLIGLLTAFLPNIEPPTRGGTMAFRAAAPSGRTGSSTDGRSRRRLRANAEINFRNGGCAEGSLARRGGRAIPIGLDLPTQHSQRPLAAPALSQAVLKESLGRRPGRMACLRCHRHKAKVFRHWPSPLPARQAISPRPFGNFFRHLL